NHPANPTAEDHARWAVTLALEEDPRHLFGCPGSVRLALTAAGRHRFAVEAEFSDADLLRDLFGNPFRPAAVDPAWLAWNDGVVGRLAEAAYSERESPSGQLSPARLALVADALEDAGCADADLLGHLRSSGPHVRGCWAVDRLSGRT